MSRFKPFNKAIKVVALAAALVFVLSSCAEVTTEDVLRKDNNVGVDGTGNWDCGSWFGCSGASVQEENLAGIEALDGSDPAEGSFSTWIGNTVGRFDLIHAPRDAVLDFPPAYHAVAWTYTKADETGKDSLIYIPEEYYVALIAGADVNSRETGLLLHELLHVADYQNILAWEADVKAAIENHPTLIETMGDTYDFLSPTFLVREMLADLVALNYGVVGDYVRSVERNTPGFTVTLQAFLDQIKVMIPEFGIDMDSDITSSHDLLPSAARTIGIDNGLEFQQMATSIEAVSELLEAANAMWASQSTAPSEHHNHDH